MELKNKLSKDLIQKIPKAELHCHLDGSLRIETIIDLAKKNNIKIPSFNFEDLKNKLCISKNFGSLEEYISKFDITLSVLQTPISLRRVAYELAEDCHNDGVRYLEVRYSPFLHISEGMSMSETVKYVKLGLDDAKKDFGIHSGIIICGIRNTSPDVSLELAKLSIKYKNNGIVGFDLAGAEKNFPAKDHKIAFQYILENNINTTLHAGEAFGPDSIHQAIHNCGAHRIGHGTRLIENDDLMNYVNDHRIPLEICLKSNLHTKSVHNLKNHPFPIYLKKHLRVTLNTDNRLISDTTLTDEYYNAIKYFGISNSEIKNIIINGFKSSFLPHQIRRKLIKNVKSELESEFNF